MKRAPLKKKKAEPKIKVRQMAPPDVLKKKIGMDEIRNPHAGQPVKNPIPFTGPDGDSKK